MKANMKNIIVVMAAAGLLVLSACDKHTCPTYSKANTAHTQVKA
jgi:hypothetical protein